MKDKLLIFLLGLPFASLSIFLLFGIINDIPRIAQINWSNLGPKTIAVVLFGFVGFGLMIGSYWLRTDQSSKNCPVDEPWLAQKEWRDNLIYSDEYDQCARQWVMCFIVTLISVSISFSIPKAFHSEKYFVLAIFFSIIIFGFIYIFSSIKKTIKYRKYGKSPLRLDPFPGSIGGDVGGSVDITLPYSKNHNFEIKLQSIYEYTDRRGNENDTVKNTIWSDQGHGSTEPGPAGTRIKFRFKVPSGLPDSESKSGDHHRWILEIKSIHDNMDFIRIYDIPVYATGKESQEISDAVLHKQKESQLQDLMSFIKIKKTKNSTNILYSNKRMKTISIIFISISILLCVLSIFPIFLVPAILFGAIGIYLFNRKLSVSLQHHIIKKRRKIFNLVLNDTEIKKKDISHVLIEKTSSIQYRETAIIYYSLKCTTIDNNIITIGESFTSYSQASKIWNFIAEQSDLSDIELRHNVTEDSETSH
ncbi:hypothetical protein [Motiliproteus sp. MSK22-1]|uniref:hypothetical protein n=1 Tax=Motiliproteus sp. MSK22-1 TaxID=1897630 RepID=UPI000976E2F9|nr:hypothetical protein [Motiliproteus sp. MSK22-1]OMH36206.1 hypothetical protein BGP75_10220 [Motiliproteus sp. MSK22-1]